MGDGQRILFCIHNVSRESREMLESLDPPAVGRDCFGRCRDCFERPYILVERTPADTSQGAAGPDPRAPRRDPTRPVQDPPASEPHRELIEANDGAGVRTHADLVAEARRRFAPDR